MCVLDTVCCIMIGSDLAALSWSAGNTSLFHSSEDIVEKKNLQTKLKTVQDFCLRQ